MILRCPRKGASLKVDYTAGKDSEGEFGRSRWLILNKPQTPETDVLKTWLEFDLIPRTAAANTPSPANLDADVPLEWWSHASPGGSLKHTCPFSPTYLIAVGTLINPHAVCHFLCANHKHWWARTDSVRHVASLARHRDPWPFASFDHNLPKISRVRHVNYA